MTKSKMFTVAVVVIAGLALTMITRHPSQVKFRQNEILLQEQAEQLATLTAERDRLSNLVANAANDAASDGHATELVKLRSVAEALKKQTNDLSRQLEKRHASVPSRPAPAPESHTPEYWQQVQQLAGSKPWEARDLASAIVSYASDHQNQCPSNLDQVASYLAKAKLTLSGTNQFEIIYQGSFDRLEGIARGNVAVLRDRQIWAAPDGKLMRVYGMADGTGQTVPSDDNFRSWEAEHVIAPPKSGQ